MRTGERIFGETEELKFNFGYQGHDLEIAATFRYASADLLVLLHGLGCSKESFAAAFSSPDLDRYSICAIDLPGHGKSTGRLARELYTLSSYAAITQSVISQVPSPDGRPHRLFLAGHSMGGAVGVIVAGMLQSRGTKAHLVSVDGNLVGEDCGLVSRSIAAQEPKRFAAEGYAHLLADLRSSGREDFNAWARWCESALPDAVHAAARSLVAWSDREVLLRMFNNMGNKAFIYGARDDKTYVLKRLKRAAKLPITAAGHFMMVDNEKSFYQGLSGALRTETVKTYSPVSPERIFSRVTFRKSAPISSKWLSLEQSSL